MAKNTNYQIYLIDSTTGSTGNFARLDTEGIDFSNVWQVADVADITKRKDAISKTLTFKATKNNNIVFGNLSNLNRMVDDSVNLSFFFNFNITKDIDCIVYENTTLILKGKLHFISCNRDSLGNLSYECSIKGYMVDFFSVINDKLLSELDFTPFNHTYNIQNIQNSWKGIYQKNNVTVTGATGTGYVYGLIDYGEGVTTDIAFDNKIDYRNLRPSFYVKEYFNAIFNQSGLTGDYRYTLTGSTTFLDEMNKAIIPNNDSDFSYSAAPATIFEVVKTSNPAQYTGKDQLYRDNTYNRMEYNHLIGFDTVISGGTGQLLFNPALINGQRIVVNNKINTTLTVSATYSSIQTAGTDVTLKLMCLYRTSSTAQFNIIAETDKEYKFNSPIFQAQYNPVDTLNLTFTQTFEAGSEIAFVVYLEGVSVNNFIVNLTNADVKIGSTLAASQVTLNLGDKAVLVGQNTQSVKQIDFLKSFIQMFNLYVYADPEDPKHIIFIPYNDYYENFVESKLLNSSINWTEKIDNASFTQTPVSDIFKLYTFKFKDDTDFYSKYYKDKYGDTYGNLTITGTTNGQNKNIELIFGSTPVASYNGRNVPALWELDTNNTKKIKVTVPRVLFYNGLQNCPDYEIGKILLSASTQTYYFQSIASTGYSFGQYPEVNEFTKSIEYEFVDLTFGIPKEVFYTGGGIIQNYGSGKKTLYDRYYADQIAELTDSNARIIETTAYLTPVDIQTLDFRKPVYFNSVLGQNYFKLLSVEYSNVNEPAKIKLQTVYQSDKHVDFEGYRSYSRSNYIKKNDCSASGYTGELVYYFVPEGRYISYVSREDVEAKVTLDVSTSGQTFANANGVCINTGVTFNLGADDSPTIAYTTTGRTDYVTSTGTLNTGSILFGFNGTQPIRNYNQYYANDNYYYLTDTHSQIISSGSTASLSGVSYSVSLVSGSTNTLSCQYANNNTYPYVNYSISNPYITVNTIIKDAVGSAVVPDGYYSDSTYAYLVSGGTGNVTSITTCRVRPPLIS
ncbi:MAG: DUF5977 domain-containing protein [Bacteroidota bacterium]